MSEIRAVDTSNVVRPMTVQVVKTRAETALSEHFAAAEAQLPGGERVRRLRREAIGRFSALGLPHRRIEEWKYTDLRALLKDAYPAGVAVDASARGGAAFALGEAIEVRFVDQAGTVPDGLPEGVSVTLLQDALAQEPKWLMDRIAALSGGGFRDATVALNTALMAGGAIVRIAAGVKLDRPLHLAFTAGRTVPAALGIRNIVIAEPGASAVIVESYDAPAASPRQRHVLTEIDAGEGAEIAHVHVIESVKASAHVGATFARLGAKAAYRPFQMTLGTGLVRHDIDVTFAGEGGAFDLGATVLLDREGHADTTLVVDHAVPGCTSRELVKAVLDGHARGIFQGKVIVRPDAQKTDGKQMAQALMLSQDAEFDSKPELEIYADDVICGHGSTCAEIDEDLLFYCRSRGIPAEQAKAMLIESFIGEAIEKVADEGVRGALAARAASWLGAGRTHQRAA